MRVRGLLLLPQREHADFDPLSQQQQILKSGLSLNRGPDSGPKAKSVALRELFGAKRNQRFLTKRVPGEIHLHVEASSIFNERPLLVADSDIPAKTLRAKIPSTKCHETTKRIVRRPGSLGEISSTIYSQLLHPFVDVFCFFSDDLGGFKQVARHLATWLEQVHEPTIPRSTRPRVVIVTEKIPSGLENEKEARKAFLWLLSEETKRDLFEQVLAIEIIALFPAGALSVNARHRLLKERIMSGSDQVRKHREQSRCLFSVTHFAAFLASACEHFSRVIHEPFDFIQASRVDNPAPQDLDEHLANLMKHIRSSGNFTAFAAPTIASSLLLDSYPPNSHLFTPEQVLDSLYKDAFPKERVISFLDSDDVILRSGFINLVRKHLINFFEQLIHSPLSAAEIHRDNLNRFKQHWMMKRIQDRIGLPIPFQQFFKVAFGISSGGLICLAMFVNGWGIEESTDTFERLAKVAFTPRTVSKIPIFRNFIELLISYFADGLYAPKNIESALKQVFGDDRSILDVSHATTTGTRVGLPVATVGGTPSRRIFTNYNGVGDRVEGQEERVIKPKDGSGNVPLWEIARSASAALGFFPPKHIRDVGTFQDAGPFVNDPLILALSEAAALFPLSGKPDFVISLGTGEPHHADVPDRVKPSGKSYRISRLEKRSKPGVFQSGIIELTLRLMDSGQD
ncbi:hypothetical protein EG328_006861 [Venturia inaequalis]|uniref:PNPLA domain-containing protein n=1 Tax=Venturia inaequalis TaxID=5025 RepID=A0A8H3YRM0_VENIN|nr:hypothetical protein EG328_006861 [Venturia inaequalis]